MDKSSRLARFARSLLTGHPGSGDGFESARVDAGRMLEWVDDTRARSDEERGRARDAVRKVARGEPLSPPEAEAFEAIVLTTGRPALDIVNGTYSPPRAPWAHLGQPSARRLIEAAIPAVGRVEVPGHPSIPYAGTGFVVGDGLLMTNRHVAEIFASGLGIRDLQFRSGLESSGVDFRRELGSAATEPFAIREIVMVHPYWDMALLRIEGLRNRVPLTLQADPPQDLLNQEVVVIGYPAEDPRNDHDLQQRIFGGRFQVKRLQPGTLTGARSTTSFGHLVPAMTHNSSTLGGNSGSAVISVATGQVVGLHFGGFYLDANFSVPAYELSRDPYVIDAGVRLTRRHTGVLPWKGFWDTVSRELRGPSPAPAPPAPAPPVPAGTIQVTIPITVTISVGAPVTAAAPAAVGPAPGAAPVSSALVDEARSLARAAEALPYYDAAEDRRARDEYYGGVDLSGDPFDALRALLESTHDNRPGYQPMKWLYPWVDRQENGRLRSLYSKSGRSFTFEEIIAMDEGVMQERRERMLATEAVGVEALEAIEAALPFNCEHVVPQSWFNKKEPMRGDLHHLFACESGCNSFRGNRAFFDFLEEAVREDCGRSGTNEFEPGAGKGAVARATLYFLVRYAGKLTRTRLPEDRLAVLARWHAAEPVSTWERHRNQAIFATQGNRNPFIDFPDLVARVSFVRGLSRRGDEGPVEDEDVAEFFRR